MENHKEQEAMFKKGFNKSDEKDYSRSDFTFKDVERILHSLPITRQEFFERANLDAACWYSWRDGGGISKHSKARVLNTQAEVWKEIHSQDVEVAALSDYTTEELFAELKQRKYTSIVLTV